MRPVARNPRGKVAAVEVAKVVLHLAPVILRPLVAPGVLMLGHHQAAVQGRIKIGFEIFTVCGVRPTMADPNTAIKATHANWSTLLLNTITRKSKRQSVRARVPAATAVPAARAESALIVHHPQPSRSQQPSALPFLMLLAAALLQFLPCLMHLIILLPSMASHSQRG